MRKVSAIFGVLVVAAAATALAAQAALTTNDIVRMAKSGIGDDAIIQAIQSSGTPFRLSVQDAEWLKQQGVSDRIMVAMVVSRPAPPPPAQAAQPPPAPAQPAPPPPPTVAPQPSGREYVGGMADQQVVPATPVAPPATYYEAPPANVYYYSPYYYYPGPYYYGPPVRFYFGFGGWHHHR